MNQIRPDWPYLRRAFVSWDPAARTVNFTPRASSREWFGQADVAAVVRDVFDRYLYRPFAEDPPPGAMGKGDVATPRVLAADLTHELRMAFPSEDVLVQVDGAVEFYDR